MAKITIIDPPSGWQFGFPRPYKPLPGETFAGTLVRYGYPKQDADWAAEHTRFWTDEEEEA